MSEEKIGFSQEFKKYSESGSYDNYNSEHVEFDAEFLELDSITDILTIMDEINKLSLRLFKYGTLCDSQNRVLHKIEDEFDKWKAEKYYAEQIDDKQFKSEKAKERYLMVTFSEEYSRYQNLIHSETYKLSLLQRVVRSLENYGYKLHDLKDYNLAIERNS